MSSRPEELTGAEVYNPHISAIQDGMLDPPTPEEVDENAVRFNLHHLDKVVPGGLDLSGSLYVIQGVEKHRKTTTALNWIRTICRSGKLKDGFIAVDVLESRSSPRKYKQALICMEATAILAMEHFGDMASMPWVDKGLDEDTGGVLRSIDTSVLEHIKDPKCKDEYAWLFRLNVKRAMSGWRTPMQQWAIEKAFNRVQKWPIYLFGAPSKQGSTKLLELPGNGRLIDKCYPYRRWAKAIKAGAKIIVVDHCHAYNVPAGYDTLEKVVMHISAAVAQLGVCVIAVAQTSLGTERTYARGGTKLSEEASIVLMPKYKRDGEQKFRVRIDCLATEDEPPVNFYVPIEPYSGLFFPKTYPV
jgi:hypothetical protein